MNKPSIGHKEVAMLKNALLYVEQIREKELNTWYDDKYKYFCGESGFGLPEFPDNNLNQHYLASVDSKDEVLGLIRYTLDRGKRTIAYSFGVKSYAEGSATFAEDALQAIENIFMKYNADAMFWTVVDGNPVVKHYIKFCFYYGGRMCAYRKLDATDMYGNYRDSYTFELLRYNYMMQRKEDNEPLPTKWMKAIPKLDNRNDPFKISERLLHDGLNDWEVL